MSSLSNLRIRQVTQESKIQHLERMLSEKAPTIPASADVLVMELGTFPGTEDALKEPAHEVVDLTSDEDGVGKKALVKEAQRMLDAHLKDSIVAGVEDESDDDDDEEEWEIDSLLEDAIEEIGDETLCGNDSDACTLDEALHYRQLLRSIGPEEFCRSTVEADKITAKKLLTAFGIRPPPFFEGQPDEAYYSLLGLALSRELSKRMKLDQYNSFDDAVSLIRDAKNIIVLTGAGISTSLGIPDFRSKDIGLYSKLQHLGLSDPQEVFDINLFKDDPSIFYSIARDILPNTSRFSPTHAFIHLLQEKGKLLTNYTQNIDNLEGKAGILPEKLIQCHGSFATATCMKCQAKVPGDAILADVKAGIIPRCTRCIQALKSSSGTSMKRKRSQSRIEKKRLRRFNGSPDSSLDEDDDVSEAGVMKPDITFFGEALPDTFADRLTTHDKDLVDLVIVIGTSLKVAPVSEVIPYLPANIPQMYISRETVSHVNFDIDMLGDCDVVVAELCRRLEWNLEHEMIPKKQAVSVILQDGFQSRHIFKEIKDVAT